MISIILGLWKAHEIAQRQYLMTLASPDHSMVQGNIPNLALLCCLEDLEGNHGHVSNFITTAGADMTTEWKRFRMPNPWKLWTNIMMFAQ